MTSIVESRPETSWNAAWAIPSISTRKLNPPYGSTRWPGADIRRSSPSAFADFAAAVPQADADDDELGGPHGRHLDLDEQPAQGAARRRGPAPLGAPPEGPPPRGGRKRTPPPPPRGGRRGRGPWPLPPPRGG